MKEAYLGYRLNQPELVDLLNRGSKAEKASVVEDLFTKYTAKETDWREGSFTSEQVQGALQSLGLKEQFQGLSEDRVWSAEDRAVYRRLSQPTHDPVVPVSPGPVVLDPRLAAKLDQDFASWDRDGSTRLEKSELDYLMSGGFYGEKLEVANDPPTAAALATVMRYHSLLEAGNPNDGSGISLTDVVAWTADTERVSSGAMIAVNEVYAEYLEKAQGMTDFRALDSETIAPGEIRQGVSGSCVLLATAAGLTESALASKFQANSNGTYTISLEGDVTETVTEPSLAERLYQSQGKDADRWPALLEIAAAQHRATQPGWSSQRGEEKPGLRSFINGIEPEFAFAVLTGKEMDQRSLDEMTLAQTRELLTRVVGQNGPVICGSRPTASTDFINCEELHNGIANGHCYSVKGYDPDTQTVTLQNPTHGKEWEHHKDESKDGVFSMPLKDFYSSYRWVASAKLDAAA